MRRLLIPAAAAVGCLAGSTVVATSAAADGATLTISVSSPRQVQSPLTVSGTLTSAGQPVPNAMVSLSRTDPGAQPSLQATGTTGADGGYSLSDTPDVRGQVTYSVTATDPSDPNGVTTDETVTVTGLTPTLTVTSDRRVVDSGRQAHLTVHLAGPSGGAVTLYATPYHRSRSQVASGSVDSSTGNLTASYRMQRRTTFQASFAGDAHYEPATTRLTVRARGVLGERLAGGYRRSGRFRLYHVTQNPRLVAGLLPSFRGACIHFRAERRSDHRWHTSARSGCVHTDANGVAVGLLTGDHVVGDPYRVRAEWDGNRFALARRGRWLKLKFHR